MLKLSVQLAYITGIALGDGNLSRPNGRATRLRVSCDNKYSQPITEIKNALTIVFPTNKVATVIRKGSNCTDVSVYSNQLNTIIPWAVGAGTKIEQSAHVPKWILDDPEFSKACLKGLLQTDGSIYFDRKYIMVNFTNLIKPLIDDVYKMIETLEFKPKLYQTTQKNGNIKYVVSVSKNVQRFIDVIGLAKN